ncbi:MULTISPECIES: hypothetical protein [Halorussus]|uniref:DUF7523 family protein n=1 Tax=Halorussus TaxID=1070314 RepID=UPI000E216A8B|nr:MULTISPECIES: hypothetical protein [Halorussus]NHN58621.1 hypothetical protein [Halorussus sp. JP-T4]
MSLAEDTRDTARRRPFLLAALRAGVVNYTAAARYLSGDVDGDIESIATALRRFAESLPDPDPESRTAAVSMKSGLGETEEPADALLAVGGTALAPDAGSLTGVVATGDVDARALAHVLWRLDAAGVDVRAAGVAGDGLAVAVERRDGPDAVRVVEDALDAVPAE